MIRTKHSTRSENGNIEGFANDCVGAALLALVRRNPICARTTRTPKRSTGRHASTTTGVLLDYGLWPTLANA